MKEFRTTLNIFICIYIYLDWLEDGGAKRKHGKSHIHQMATFPDDRLDNALFVGGKYVGGG